LLKLFGESLVEPPNRSGAKDAGDFDHYFFEVYTMGIDATSEVFRLP